MAFAWPHGKRAALSVSFDDARLSQMDAGVAALDRHGVKATFYVIPGSVEKRLPQWKNAVAAGHEIGNHTVTHPCSCNFGWVKTNALEDFTLERMQKEFDDADAGIARLLGVKPRSFAYPCGQTFVGRGAQLQSYIPLVARHFEFGRAYHAEVAADPERCDLANLPSTSFDGKSFAEIRDFIERAAAENRWVLLVAHDTGDIPGLSVRLDVLDELCRYAADARNGLWVDTIAAVGDYLRKVRG